MSNFKKALELKGFGNAEMTKMMNDRLELKSEFNGKKKKVSLRRKEKMRENYNKLMGIGNNKRRKFKTALDPDIIKRQKEAQTEKEKKTLKTQKRRLFLDFFGCAGWR